MRLLRTVAPALLLCLPACHHSFSVVVESSSSLSQPPQHKEPAGDSVVSAGGVTDVKATVEVGTLTVRSGGKEVHAHWVRGWDGTPDAEGKRLLEKAIVVVKTENGHYSVLDEVPDELKNGNHGIRNIRLDLTLDLPDALPLDAHVGVGDVKATGKFGDAKLDTGVGSVIADGQFGDVTAHSGTGDVKLSGSAKELRAESGVGTVNVSKLALSGKSCVLTSGTGDITGELTALPSHDVRAASGVGSVSLRIPRDAKATAKLSTGVGGVHSDLGLQQRERGIGQVGGEMSGTINGGGTTIDLHSGTGDASLNRLE